MCEHFAHQASRFWDFHFLPVFCGYAKPKVLGANPSLVGQKLNLLGQNSSLLVHNSSQLGQNSSLQGENPSLLGQNRNVLGQNPSLLGQDSDLYFLIPEVVDSFLFLVVVGHTVTLLLAGTIPLGYDGK